jgi:hypothetical protein
MEPSPSEAVSRSTTQEILNISCKAKGSLPWSNQPSISLYPEVAQSSPCQPIRSL